MRVTRGSACTRRPSPPRRTPLKRTLYYPSLTLPLLPSAGVELTAGGGAGDGGSDALSACGRAAARSGDLQGRRALRARQDGAGSRPHGLGNDARAHSYLTACMARSVGCIGRHVAHAHLIMFAQHAHRSCWLQVFLAGMSLFETLLYQPHATKVIRRQHRSQWRR